MFFKFVLIFIGGGIGAICRYSLNLIGEYIITTYFDKIYPLGTFSANIIGSFFIGILFGIFRHNIIANENLELFLIVGLLGGFTTFSSFSLEIYKMIAGGEYFLSGIYIVLSITLAVTFTFLGYKIVSSI